MAELSGEVLKHFGRHIVTLECTYSVLHRNKPHEDARNYYTGFILYSGGAYVWVTAGHCLAEIDEILANTESLGNVRFQLIDTLHDATVSDLPVPFDYVSEKFRAAYWNRDGAGNGLGHDYGAIFLRSHYARLLDANGIKPVGEDNWKNVPNEFDAYYMLGLPGERTCRNDRGQSVVRPSMFSVTKFPLKPDRYAEHVDPMFYATIDPDNNISNIQGMSGGPIIGFKNLGENNVRYWFLAVQSGWYKPERLICASPLEDLDQTIKDVVETFRRPDKGAALPPSSTDGTTV
jgi:hypothetical protein